MFIRGTILFFLFLFFLVLLLALSPWNILGLLLSGVSKFPSKTVKMSCHAQTGLVRPAGACKCRG
jgi:hypothetical protein